MKHQLIAVACVCLPVAVFAAVQAGDRAQGKPARVSAPAPTFNVRDYGAVGDGKADDTAAIQACIDAAPEGDVVRFPRGRYKTTKTITTNKTLALVGVSAYAQFMGLFGDRGYGSVAERGSVIECTATSGYAIDHSPGRYTGLRIEHLAIKGIGDDKRTTGGVRIAYEKGSVEVGMIGVQISNFKIGLDLGSIENSHFDRVRINGCDTGIYCRPNTNANVFTCLSLSGCGDGVVADGAGTNVFQGGAVQGSLRNGVLFKNSSDENTIQGIYFENPKAKYAVNVATGVSAASIETCHFGTEGDNILFAGNWCRLLSGKYARTVTILGYGAQIVGACSGKIVDTPSGPPTVIVGDQTGGVSAAGLTLGGSLKWSGPDGGELKMQNRGLRFKSNKGRTTTLTRP